jgi:hypothetical protein
MTETSVDPVEEARRTWKKIDALYRYEGGEPHDRFENGVGHSHEFPSSLTAAILASDPRVQALEAVARAAEDALEDVANSYIDRVRHLEAVGHRQKLREALAALQEVTE